MAQERSASLDIPGGFSEMTVIDGADDVVGLVNVATRAPDRATEEIDRMGSEDGIVGVGMLPGGEYQKPLGDPRPDSSPPTTGPSFATWFFIEVV